MSSTATGSGYWNLSSSLAFFTFDSCKSVVSLFGVRSNG